MKKARNNATRHAKVLWTLPILGFAAIAGSVEVNGTTWQCQHSCSVTTYPGGGTMVRDSAGGWIRRLSRA